MGAGRARQGEVSAKPQLSLILWGLRSVNYSSAIVHLLPGRAAGLPYPSPVPPEWGPGIFHRPHHRPSGLQAGQRAALAADHHGEPQVRPLGQRSGKRGDLHRRLCRVWMEDRPCESAGNLGHLI